MRFLAIISLALLAAACGSSPSSPSANQGSNNSPEQAPFKYARCMRDHGVPNFPDPQVTTTPGGGGGSVSQAVPAGAANSPKFKAAEKACASLQPAANGGPGPHGPSTAVLLAFARCLRSHGISSFPDPSAQGRLTIQMIDSAGVDLHAPGFFTAAKACVGVTHGAIPLAAVEQLVSGRH